ncbi:MAG: 3'-5' exonuclease, partial [Acidimicrobiales bacterium]
LGTPALRAWLARRIAENTEAADETDAEERSRRLESDAEAVQVLTVHRAKGLEFPTVYCPYLWDPGRDLESGQPLLFHDGRHGFVRSLDVGGDGSDDSNLRAARSEQVGEDLRLLYVALTRARHQLVLWWAQSYRSQHSPLGRLLVSRQPDGDVADGGKKPPSDQAILQHLEAVAAKAPSLVSIERCTPPPGGRWEPDRAAISNLRAAAFARRLDLSWRRTSYTAITSGAHDPAYAGDPIVGSEPEEPGTTDEPAVATGAPSVPAARAAIAGNRALGGERPARGAPGMTGGVAEDHLRSVRSSWAEVPGGRSMGTFVHQVLQRTDFAAASLESEVATAVAAQADGRPGGPEAPEVLVAAIVGSLSTPLGPIVGNASLRALGRADRLDEVGFELPLAGGDHPSGEVLTTDVANLLSAHTRPGDPLEGYATRLTSPALASHLRGYLTGSIDLVARFPDHTGAARYLVVDYKTNWLAPEGEGLSAWHYRPDALAAEMQRAHYPLQALLYVVALHRYLRWRLPGYAAESHLGGVLYLFLRGMAGPATPVTADSGVPCGVFTWRTPAALVTGLSDLIDRGPEQ